MCLSLIILAAGRGSRFGGDKPLAAVGPDGQSLFEYSVYDAAQSGISHIVFVVSKDQDTNVFEQRLSRYGDGLKVDFVVQSLDNFAEHAAEDVASLTRSKPWGTGHAVLACREIVNNPFIVINADDYYGRENFLLIGEYLLRNSDDTKACALAGYKLGYTLSTHGSVNRGICHVDAEGYLLSITELNGISCDANKMYSVNHIKSETLTDDTVVSMTFWGFQPAIFDILSSEFNSFLAETGDLMNSEFFIPEVVDRALNSHLLRVRVFPTSDKWKGLTYASDITEVRSFIADLVKIGEYAEL